jgi:AcrR family transcriptional regulator
MHKRAASREDTRARIVRATMQVHDEKGIGPATMSEIAQRAGVGLATVLRHFPTYGQLVQTCGMHVWQELRPPVPDAAAAVFAGLEGRSARLARLVEELDGFYARGALRLRIAGRDRETVPEVAAFFAAVEAGIAAYVAEALRPEDVPRETLATVTAIMGFPVWSALEEAGLSGERLAETRLRLATCAMASAGS